MKRGKIYLVGTRIRRMIEERKGASEAGDTLIEVLLALLVLGLASVALIIAFGTSISASGTHRNLATFDNVLTGATQTGTSLLEQQESLFQTCPSGSPAQIAAIYQSNALLGPLIPTTSPYYGQYSAQYTSVKYWDPATNSFDTTCTPNGLQPQLITITAINLTTGKTYTNSFVVDYSTATSGSQGSGTAATLVWLVQPSGGSTGTPAGTPLATQPVVEIVDSNGNPVSTDLSPIVLTLGVSVGNLPNGAALSGCSGNEILGVVTFTGCTVNTAGSSYTLTASDGPTDTGSGVASITSNPFQVIDATGNLVFSTQPKGGNSGLAFATVPVVQVDENGSYDSSWSGDITVTVSGGTLANCTNNLSNAPDTVTLATSNGQVSLAGCTFAGNDSFNQQNETYTATPYSLTATATGMVPATSNVFTVAGVGTAAQLGFSTEPTGANSATLPAAFAGSFAVEVEDSFGNVIQNPSLTPTLSISSGMTSQGVTVPETLASCTHSVIATVAITYSNCTASAYANSVTLGAQYGSGGSAFSATSSSFNVTGVASQLVFTAQPVAGASGTQFSTQPVIVEEDSGGNLVTSATTPITLSLATGASTGSLTLCSGLTPSGGTVTVASCQFAGIVGTSYTMTASATGMTSATSSSFSPTTYGSPTQLVYTTNPVAGLAGSIFTVQPVIKVEDSAGNVVTSSAATITLATNAGTLWSCSGLSAITGVVSVTGCNFGGLDTTNYTLTASSTGLTSAVYTFLKPSGPGPVSPAASTVVASPLKVPANGSTSSTVTVTLYDAWGNTVSGKAVQLVPGSGTSIVTIITGTTNAGGVATFGVTATTAQAVTYTAIDTTDPVTVTQTATVNFLSTPTITGVSPTSRGQGATGQTLTVTGTGFVNGSGLAVSFSGTGITVISTTYVNATTLSVVISIATNATTGTRTLTVTNPDGGTGTSGAIFTVNAGPTVTAVNPSSENDGATNQNLTVTGTGFVNGTGLFAIFSGTGIGVNSTTYVNSTTLTVNVTIASNAPTGTRTISVTNPDGGTGTSGAIFTVKSGPTITAVNPSSLDQGATSQNLTLTGTNFVNGASLATVFSGTGITVNSTTYVNATTLTVNVTVAGNATTGTRTITLTNGDGSTATSGSIFTVNGAPTVTGVNPASRGQGATNQNLTITGTNFDSGAALATAFSGTGVTVNSTTYVNSTTLTVNVTISGSATVGTRTITVTNGDGTTATSGAIFTVNAAPTVTGANPAALGQGATSQNLTITGTGFSNGASLATAFSGTGITVNSTTYVNATTLTVNVTIASNATTGTRTITVTNGDAGVGTSGSIFTVDAAPTVLAVNPNALDQGAINQSLTVTGTGFINGAPLATAFSGTGITVNSTTYVSATTLTVNVSIASNAATGTRTITVTNGDAGVGTSAAIFAVNAAPTITGVNPSSLDRGATSQNLTVTGTGFINGVSLATAFSASGITVNSTTFVNATTLTVNVTISGAATTGTHTITLTNGDGSTATSGSIFTVNAAPTITGVNPASLDQGATSQNLAVSGTGFINGGSLATAFSGTGITVNSTTFVNATTLTVNVTIAGNATVGARTISLTNGDGSTATSGAIFTVNAAPTITGVNPASRGQGATSQNLTVTGTNFINGGSLATAFSGTGIAVNSTTYVNATTLTVNVTIAGNAATGARTISLTNGDGSTATSGAIFTVNAAPTVTGVNPASADQGATGYSLTVTGTGFVNGAPLASAFSGTGITVNSTTYVNAATLTLNVTIAGGAATGTRTITVTNGDGGVATSGSIFTVNGAPTVTGVNPASLDRGATSQNLTVSGTGFINGASLSTAFSASGITVNSTTYVNATTLTVNVSISTSATLGTHTITLTNGDGSTATSGAIFTVNAAPTVTGVNPASLDQGATSQNLTLTGTGFVNGASLATAFSGTGVTVNSTTYVSATSITVNVTIAGNATTGTRTITLTNGDGSNVTSGSIFTVNAAPTVTGVNPASLDQGATSQNLSVTGTNFINGASLLTVFSGTGITVNSTTYVSATSLTVNVTIAGNATTGTRTITLTNGDGSAATSGSIFTVNAAPTITAVNPTSRGQGAAIQNLTVTGTNFINGASLLTVFSGTGITVNSTAFVNATTLTVNVSISGSATTGTRTFTVTNGDGSTATSGSIFTVNAAPTITGVNPTSRGQGAAAQILTLTGTGFVNGASLATVFSGAGITVNSTTYVSATSLTVSVTIATGATIGTRTITVTNGDAGVGTSGTIFTVNAGPTVTGVNPATLDQGAINQNLTVSGSGFVNGVGLAASFSGTGITVNSTTYVNATTLTVNVSILGTATVGAQAITVTNPDAGNGTSGAIFTIAAKPTITAVNAASADQGATNFSVTVTGTNFINGASLATVFSGTGITVNSTTYVSGTSLTVSVTIASNATLSARTITLTNGDGSTATSGSIFTVNAAPTVTAVSPASRGAGATNQNLTVTGTGFVNGPALATAFSGTGITVNSTTYVSATSLTVNVTILGSAATGTRTISLTNGDGSTATSGSIFTVNAAPTVTGVNAAFADQGATNYSVTVTGTGFVNAAGLAATFSGAGITVNSTTYVSATSLTVNITILGSAATGTRTITVTNPDGGAGTSGSIFTVNAAPTITSITPNTEPRGNTYSLPVVGTGFINGPALALAVNTTRITGLSVTYNSATSLTFTFTVANSFQARGTWTFTLTNGDGSTTTVSFTVT